MSRASAAAISIVTKSSGLSRRLSPLSSFAFSQLGPMTTRTMLHSATWRSRCATKSTPAGMWSTSMKIFFRPNVCDNRSYNRPAVLIESSRR